jgi:two-component system response regulator MprA
LLIIDDDADTCSALSELLTFEGYSCVSVSEGAEGLRLLEGDKPDLVVLDVFLRDMDVVTFLRLKAAMASAAAVPVILVTAGPNIGVLDGAVTLLRKPFGIDELVSEIRKYLATAPKPEDAQLAGGDLTVVRHGQEQGYGEEDRSHT